MEILKAGYLKSHHKKTRTSRPGFYFYKKIFAFPDFIPSQTQF